MESGLSFESFGGLIGRHRDTLYEWLKVHREFSDARKKGDGLCRLWWEKVGMAGMSGKARGFNAAIWIFNMKNRFGWANEKRKKLPSKLRASNRR